MIYCVIPVFNRREMLRGCLASLGAQTDRIFRVIVVDDGSTDGTFQMLESEFPDVKVFRGDGNLWWTAAINKGVEYALTVCGKDDNLLILNDDLVVPPDYFANFVSLTQAYHDTLIGSVVTDIDDRDRICSGGVRINWLTAKQWSLNSGKALSSFGKGYIVEVSLLTGRGVLIPAKVFRELGLYNDRHYKQCGDTELPVRAWRAGYRLIVSYDVPVFSHIRQNGHLDHAQTDRPSDAKKYYYRLSDAKEYYFGIRSNANLRYRFWFAYDTSANIIQGTLYLICDLIRITKYFLLRRRT